MLTRSKKINLNNHMYNLLLLMLISIPALTIRLEAYPKVWFDEGYKLNAAYTLATEHVYGTQSVEGLHPFDPLISTGPADIVPIALSFALFGAGVLQARLVIVLYAILALVSLYFIAEYLYGPVRALIFSLVVLAAPSIQGINFAMLGRQVLGEIPALAFILLGLWMAFISWETRKVRFSVISGFAMGLGLLSKNQVAFALLPAISLLIAVAAVRYRQLFWLLSISLSLILSVQLGWAILGYMYTPEIIREENYLLLRESVQIHVLTGLFGSTLTTQGIFITLFMVFGAMAAAFRLWFFNPNKGSNKSLAEAMLVIFVFFSAIWYALFSIGWPRYTFFGMVFAWLFVGQFTWEVIKFTSTKIATLNANNRKMAMTSGVVSLSVLALFTSIYPISQAAGGNSLREVGEYIRENIDDQDLIETWEYELVSTSGHVMIHHPHQRYILQAIRQYFHEQQSFDLKYNLMIARPQYLITGPFSDWTSIYDPLTISEYFEEVSTIGPYRVYQRTDSLDN
jgi:hypothetical protein